MGTPITDVCAVCRAMIWALPRIGCRDCAQLPSCMAGVNKEASYCSDACLNRHKVEFHAVHLNASLPVDEAQRAEQIVKDVAWLARGNLHYLTMAPTLPKLYESGVRYDVSLDGEGHYEIPTILNDPADCSANIESLVAWRCAELWQQGIKVSPYLKWYDREGGGRHYTMVVLWPDGTEEDVGVLLGGPRRATR